MAGGGTGGGVAQTVAQRGEAADRPVQIVGPGRKLHAIQADPARLAEHADDFVQREAGRLGQGDQRQPLQHARLEQSLQPPPTYRGDQAFLLVVAEPGGRHARSLSHLRDIEKFHG
jgi:hypothetical protein